MDNSGVRFAYVDTDVRPGFRYYYDVRAYDVRTGELEWVFHTVPRAGEFGSETWPNNAPPMSPTWKP